MSNNKPSAFPDPMRADPQSANTTTDPGMTLLDYFAAKAMQSILLSDEWKTFEKTAEESYQMAVRMMERRKEVECP